ncbi:MFS transporter [Nocardia sp. 852002-20019_SCH5090214]|jgi:DHA1 family inner membrane transport protein|uniref:MFS transporter n=1 Tax=Nocardia nova TaxID=37330 RepID=A0A2S5ZXB0_9NOCA|nr:MULTISPECIES: MFS transporter [Nocardia]OBF64551.1 MFS transporter [Mycobacterium sp. 852002-51759_SCH5129042]MBF6272475.1 MFS transporter [Nocardia nova]MBV7702641.1 MFS transporter [Nocardia nova]OBA48527.1 MFS transporter [Nocardia sp. 852002-51101_SCH5132738]OBA57013.1 MFS transporter [Nocardia sp. 852002-20019_SCH5090214]
MPLALLALTLGAFAIGTTEFIVVGLLPGVADSYAVSIPTAGWLVTGYALGVLVGAPVMTGLGTRVSRKRMLLISLLLLIAGNALSAAAPTFGLMLTGRIIASLAHGAFFGIGAVVAGSLVAPDRRAGAIAMMFTGLTVATVVGVPLSTLLGQHFGWRLAFALVAAVGALAFAGVLALVPDRPAPRDARFTRELAVLRNPQVLLAMAMTVLGFGGVFAAITYLAPMMTEVTGFAETSVTWIMVLFGLGFLIGNLVGGRYADRHLLPMLYITLAALAVVLALFTLTAHNKVAAAITVVLIGALGFATVPPLQKRVLDQAAAAPTLASALNIGAFNLGNALAAWLGGSVIAAGFGYTSSSWVGVVLATSALGSAVWSGALERRTTRSSTAPEELVAVGD